jgi:hypothetical protein
MSSTLDQAWPDWEIPEGAMGDTAKLLACIETERETVLALAAAAETEAYIRATAIVWASPDPAARFADDMDAPSSEVEDMFARLAETFTKPRSLRPWRPPASG